MHEAKLHDENSFITLTYDEYHIPTLDSLDKSHVPAFIKTLRKHLGTKKIRYFHCGEYGEALGRPHYHILLFGHWFPDSRVHSQSKSGSQQWTSATLDRLWGKGLCTIGTVTYQSAAYCARYILKKVTGDQADYYYDGKEPEYITMSRRPGIGSGWFDLYSDETFPDDFIVVDGKKHSVPRYYEKLQKRKESELIKSVKQTRRKKSITRKNYLNNQPDRLDVRAAVLTGKINLYKRNL